MTREEFKQEFLSLDDKNIVGALKLCEQYYTSLERQLDVILKENDLLKGQLEALQAPKTCEKCIKYINGCCDDLDFEFQLKPTHECQYGFISKDQQWPKTKKTSSTK